jgi:adenine-specific DNA-methyltransferase
LIILCKKNYLDNSYTRFQNKIGLNIAGKYLKERDEVCLVWPYKDCLLEGGQVKESEQRKEIFFNEVLAQDEITRLLAPKVLTRFIRYSPKSSTKITNFKRDQKGIIRENFIIKGNNLLTLQTFKTQFKGQIKLIYIDPPYNTGSEGDTFSYNNYFKHSSWLTFMENRLKIAKDYLSEDGFIAIAIDQVELFYLGVLADEIFGRDNRVGFVTVLNNPKGRNLSKFFSSNSEFMLVYAKNIEMAEFNQVAISEEVKDLFTYKDDDGKFRYEPFMRARTVWSRENKPNNWYPIYVSKDLKIITVEKIEGYHEIFPITNNGKEMAWKNIKKSFINLNKN